MNPLTKQDVIDIIKEFNTTQGGTAGGFTVPRHGHNGSDMIKVIMGDLGYDSRGLIFPLADGIVHTLIVGGDTLQTSSPTGATYKQRRTVFDANYLAQTTESPVMTDIFTDNPSWFLRLPNDSILPLAPQVGDICIFNGILQVCQAPGVWTAK